MMPYTTEYIASALKTARESKGLTQRELSAKSGVPQSHISKIENGAVDLRVSSLVVLARVLDLELTLVPRKAVSAVQSIARSSERTTGRGGETSRLAFKELKRLQDTIVSLPKTPSFAKEVAQLQRQVRELQHFSLTQSDLEALKAASRTVKTFMNNTDNLNVIRQSVSQLQTLRNTLAHASVNAPQMASPRPAYSLDEDHHG
jgi:transcriptional regulator with XRE-family HTH domain